MNGAHRAGGADGGGQNGGGYCAGAGQLAAEIVSADSVQVYRRLDIGTAKPTPAEQAQVPFHAIDVADPDDEWTLADFQRLGETACVEIAERGRVPVIVGGTGLYVRAHHDPFRHSARAAQ